MEIVKREYKEPCTPDILEDIATDKAGEFGTIQQALLHEVCPNIMIGGEEIALSKYALEEIGVTHIINCAQGSDPGDVNTDARYYKGTKLKLYAIRAKDDDSYRVMPFFNVAAAYVRQCLEVGGKILVHCSRGVSLSPAIVIGTLMINNKLDVRDAFRHVRSRRNIKPNKGLIEQLCELNDQLFYQSEKT